MLGAASGTKTLSQPRWPSNCGSRVRQVLSFLKAVTISSFDEGPVFPSYR